MICAKITQRGFGVARAAGTARNQHRRLVFEGGDGLRAQVHVDVLSGFGNVRGKGSKLFVRDDAHVMGRDVIGFALMEIVDFVPDAFLLAVDNRFPHPVRGLVIQAQPVVENVRLRRAPG